MTATSKHIPSKRLKTWHRAHKRNGAAISLRAFAREIIAISVSDSRSKMEHDTVTRWAGGKIRWAGKTP